MIIMLTLTQYVCSAGSGAEFPNPNVACKEKHFYFTTAVNLKLYFNFNTSTTLYLQFLQYLLVDFTEGIWRKLGFFAENS